VVWEHTPLARFWFVVTVLRLSVELFGIRSHGDVEFGIRSHGDGLSDVENALASMAEFNAKVACIEAIAVLHGGRCG
jgi:hypothetical protein